MSLAWISGRAGRAVVDSDGKTFLVVDGDESLPQACSPRQLLLLQSTYGDVVCQSAGAFPYIQVRGALRAAVELDRARLYFVGLLDNELDDDLRRELASDLDRLVSEPSLLDRLRTLTRSAALPTPAGLHRARELAGDQGATQVVALLSAFETDAPAISRAHAAWVSFAAESFDTDNARALAEAWFVDSGGFQSLVNDLASGSSGSFLNWIAKNANDALPVFGLNATEAFRSLLSLTGPVAGNRIGGSDEGGEVAPDVSPTRLLRRTVDMSRAVKRKGSKKRRAATGAATADGESGRRHTVQIPAPPAVSPPAEPVSSGSKRSKQGEKAPDPPRVQLGSSQLRSLPKLTMKELLEAGAHFGHVTGGWNPKMKGYIFIERGGIHVIDLGKTIKLFREAAEFVATLAANGQSVLFVGTKRQARSAIGEEAARCGMFFVNQRWKGGLLTNFVATQASLTRLNELEALATDRNRDTKLSKKELARNRDHRNKLTEELEGIRGMSRIPDAMFVVDTSTERIAVEEARKLRIPVIGLVDSNSDPDAVTFVIPGNDDAMRSVRLFVSKVADAVVFGRNVAAHAVAPPKTKAEVARPTQLQRAPSKRTYSSKV